MMDDFGVDENGPDEDGWRALYALVTMSLESRETVKVWARYEAMKLDVSEWGSCDTDGFDQRNCANVGLI